jgi:hypothetical protein
MTATNSSRIVSTPFGYGNLLPEQTEAQAYAVVPSSHSPEHATEPDIETSFCCVQFPWGHAYVKRQEIADVPEFTFYSFCSLKKQQKHTSVMLPQVFTMSFPLETKGEEVIQVLEAKLHLNDEDIHVQLMQPDISGKHEIQPDLTLNQCTIGVGPSHPIWVLPVSDLHFETEKQSGVKTLEAKTSIEQIVSNQVSVVCTPEITIESQLKYWEVRLEHVDGEEGVYIGIACKNQIDPQASMIGQSGFWGISTGNGYKIHADDLMCYSRPCHDGDIIGVLVDRVHSQLTFYLNGKSLGVAFRNLCFPVCPFFALTHLGTKLKLLPTCSPPF